VLLGVRVCGERGHVVDAVDQSGCAGVQSGFGWVEREYDLGG
jgi:hypothetical protein